MKNKKDLRLYFIMSTLLVFIFSFSIFYVFEMHINNLKFEEVKESEESLVNFQNQLLEKQFRTILGDIHYLHHIYGEKISKYR